MNVLATTALEPLITHGHCLTTINGTGSIRIDWDRSENELLIRAAIN